MKTLGIIPARAGSQRLPGKNWKVFGDRPLIEWTLDAAHASKALDDVIVSTDSLDVVSICDQWGAKYLDRPAHLAGADASSYDVIFDALDFVETEDRKFTDICLLQPTSPFRTVADIDHCIDLVRMYKEDPTRYRTPAVVSANRQLAAIPNGAVYVGGVTWLRAICARGYVYPFDLPHVGHYLMPAERSVDIDTQQDWDEALKIGRKFGWIK